MADYAICYTDAEHNGMVVLFLILLGLAPFGVYAIWVYLRDMAIEFLNPADQVMIDEHLRTFKVVLRHEQQKEKLRRAAARSSAQRCARTPRSGRPIWSTGTSTRSGPISCGCAI